MTLRPLLAAMLLAGTPAAIAQPAALQDCSIAASEGLRAGEEAASIGLGFEGEGRERHVVASAPRSAQGPAPAARLARVRPGVSYGAALAPQGEGGGPEAAFTLATVEEAGTVLLETWRWRAGTGPGAAPPAYAWSRLRCGP